MPPSWFYRHAGRVHGPVTLGDLRASLLLRFVQADDLVRSRTGGTWIPAREVPELQGFLLPATEDGDAPRP